MKSFVWEHFDKVGINRATRKTVRCRLCRTELAYHNSTGSMINHMLHKHPLRVPGSSESSAGAREDGGGKAPRKDFYHQESSGPSQESPGPVTMPEPVTMAATTDLPPKAKIKMRSYVWNHFDKVGCRTTRCRHCQVELAYHASTGSMINHLQLKHPSTNPDPSTTPGLTPRKSHQDQFKAFLTSNTKSESCSPERVIGITRHITTMIADVNLPVSFVEEPSFQELLKYIEPGYSLPNQSSITVHLQLLYDAKKATAKAEIANSTSFAISTDCWASGMQEYLTLTGHYVDKEWQYKAVVLDTSPLAIDDINDDNSTEDPSDHIKAILTDHLKRVLEEWDLGLGDKVSSIVNDNSPNITDIGKDALDAFDVGCAAYLLHEAVNHGIQSHEEILNLVAAANQLVSYFHHSIDATDTLRKEQEFMDQELKGLVSSVASHWVSILNMLERLTEVRGPLLRVLSNQRLMDQDEEIKIDLTEDQWALVDLVKHCLKPLKVATFVLSSKENVASSITLPIVFGLLHNHLVKKEGEADAIVRFKNVMRNQIESRFLQPGFQAGVAAIAAAVDPRYKNLKFLSHNDREVVWAEVRKHLETLQKAHEEAKGCKADQDSSSDQEPSADSVLDFLMGTAAEPARRQNSAIDEFEEFLAQKQEPRNTNPLTWWRANSGRFPILQNLAKIYLGVPATAVPAERVFSLSGNVVTAKRSCLSPENVNMLVFLSQNK
ncbi:E3 SUMO-protein ligase ZBED1-like [Lytechinus pictus]|uniref:E3 SUMO-protein ligase ZBED1-like n=1 Tax=Lytechinus pictus TaxID=7653 RepID=UPI0030B9C042